MSIKKKVPLIFCIIVLLILVANNAFHYIRSKNQLLINNEKEISMLTNEVYFQVENTKDGSLFVENILGRDLRIASLAIKKSLPPNYQDITNEQLKALAKEVGVSHITLLAKTKDDIIGVKSSDPEEINMSTKGWGYWYDAYQQLFSLTPVSVGKGLSLPFYWSGPIEIASSNPDHIDKWGYYYDGTTNYIINPYFRDNEVLAYEKRFGPGKIINRFTKDLPGVMELTVFNPKNFGKKNEVVHLNGNSYIRISAQPIWYGTYNIKNVQVDSQYIKKAIKTKTEQSYKSLIDGKNVIKTFVPVLSKNEQPYVIGLVFNYGLIQQELNHELTVHILLSIVIMIMVLIISFIFSRSITQPIGYIVEQVNEIAQGNFGKNLHLNRKDELGLLTENVNALSNHLHNYVNDLNRSKELIEYQAYHDPLTGLPNRRYFQEKLKPIIDRSNETGGTVSVLFIDMDRFKHVNDLFGHNKGDEILKTTANRIKECMSDDYHLITRQGGDEFIILLINLDVQETMAAAERIVNSLKMPYCLDGNEIYLGASCGISLYPYHTKNLETLVIYADMAMYAAKNMGGNKAIVFNEQLSKLDQERSKLESRLRKAIEQEKIEVYYQPKIDVSSGIIFGAEALVRWQDDDFGFISPEQFIPIAEETELIHPLWELVMKKACQQVKGWNIHRSEPLSISVNFSARQFQDPGNMVKQVKDILAESGLGYENFEIEITESILLTNSKEIVQALETLKGLGISISIDDFGTGYSSLSYLKNLPIDSLKIDKSFIQDINKDFGNAEISEVIINLARSLHLNVIAEGVEKEYQKDFLLSKNCVQMQGYLFSKPLNKNDFEQFLQNEG
ncbi:bifunctional diguanylate cyclase/phosphodiesterase [Neobacillus ginsengisoli]|uniref:Diguanylate cyclase (GGDEF)-like protein n=1 Tax=Neobacillus ginsengisoli TaxID=904295 RepID=A0ABT9XT28_9BACI|nr:EAL domain-containing protein [Neobacillus ginsengisoli]MDQ0198711.1 diguanylate cyclase (GGDEF)-like protein [Neobacillus ginsengisoli]